MTAKNVTIAPEVLERAGKVAQDKGVSVDELASEALQRELGRLSLEGELDIAGSQSILDETLRPRPSSAATDISWREVSSAESACSG